VDLATSSTARARAWFGLATGLRIVDRYDEALAALMHAEQALDGSDPRSLAQLWTLRGNLHFPRGDLDACLDAHRRALEFAERARSPEDVARALGGLGDAHYQRGWMRTAHDRFRQCVELSEQHGYAGLRVTYLPMIAATRAYVGDFAAGLDACARAAAAAAEVGDLRAELLANSVRASIELNRARYDAARLCSERSLVLAREMGARRFEAESLALKGLAVFGAGDQDAGRVVLEQAVELARAVAPTYCGPWALGALALASTDHSRSKVLLAEGERLLALGCVSHNHFELYSSGIEVSLRQGDADGARRYAAALEAYTRDEPLPWAEALIARGRALARVLDGERGEDAREAVERAMRLAQAMEFLALVPALQEALAARLC
jgi:tetratricopeptide (TPR) repeat protein